MSHLTNKISNHQEYIESDQFRQEISLKQRLKGAEKYTELFTVSSHTDDELADHAMMEFHDGQEYVSGMRTRMRELREIIRVKDLVINSLLDGCECQNDG